MRAHRNLLALFTAATLFAAVTACGDDSETSDTAGPTTSAAPTTTEPTGTTVPDTVPPGTVPTTTEPATTQIALWPAADVVLATPEEAARSFTVGVLGFEPALGPFAAGDSRSGEIEVFARDGDRVIGPARSTLLLRQLAPQDGWFVIGAVSAGATIDSPESGATLPVGQVEVSGTGTGFEALVVVDAFIAGDDTLLDRQTAMAGNFGELLPYTVTLDLSGTTAGDVVVIVVRGGVGLETDPGDMAAIAIRMG